MLLSRFQGKQVEIENFSFRRDKSLIGTRLIDKIDKKQKPDARIDIKANIGYTCIGILCGMHAHVDLFL